MGYWLFQGNPKYYRVLDAIRDFDQMPWLVTRYAKEIKLGDGVLIWLAGDKSGIYAIAEVVETPQVLDKLPDQEFWSDPSRSKGKDQSVIKFTQKLLETPLLRTDLMRDPVLKSLMVIKVPNSTNFRVTAQE